MINYLTLSKMDTLFIVLFASILLISTSNATQCTRESSPHVRTFETLPSYQGNKYTFDPTESDFKGNIVKILNIKPNLEKNDFISFSSEFINRLILTRKNISSIEEGTFHSLYCLESLELQFNNLKVINLGAFEYIEHIRYLNLSHNLIDTIESETFQNLTHLISLDLSFNRIVQFESLGSKILPNFEYLNISNNLLNNFNLINFTQAHSIKFLDLSHNRLTKLQFPNKVIFENITRLMINDNNLSNLQMFNLRNCMPKLAYVTLEGNVWDCIDLTYIINLLREKNILFDSRNRSSSNVAGVDCRNGIHTTLPPPIPTPIDMTEEKKHFDEIRYNQGKVLQSIMDLKYVISYLFVFIILFVMFDVSIKAGCLDYFRVIRARRQQPLFDDVNVENLRLLSTQRV